MRRIVAVLAVAWCVLASAHAAQPPSVFLEDLTWPEVRAAIRGGVTTAIFYAGSTEQNGPHMALGKHNHIARHVAGRIAQVLGDALVYPVLPYAPTGDADKRTDHMKFPGTVTVSPETFGAVVRDVASSARAAGFRRIVLMGDHGGGQDVLERAALELSRRWSAEGIRVLYIPDVYFRSQDAVKQYLAPRGLPDGGHASLVDTSELMALDREGRWIRRDRIAAATPDSGIDGDPRQASAELGWKFLEFKVNAAVAQIRALGADPR